MTKDRELKAAIEAFLTGPKAAVPSEPVAGLAAPSGSQERSADDMLNDLYRVTECAFRSQSSGNK